MLEAKDSFFFSHSKLKNWNIEIESNFKTIIIKVNSIF